MLFNSWPYLYLLLICFTLFHTVLKNHRLPRQLMLLAASYTFYGWWDARLLGLMVFSTTMDWTIGILIDSKRRRGASQPQLKPLIVASIVLNLTLLGFFKYFNFFADNLELLLRPLGYHPSWLDLHVILPVGVSFYTFQSMAYTIDVYRDKAECVRNPITFALYVSFFPQLVAGPIERSQNLVPDLNNPRPVDRHAINTALTLLVLGFFKKIAIADPIAPYVTETLADPARHSGQRLLMGMYLFGIQLYADFSGYSDIARGSARLFGVELMRNFEQPFFSTSISEFWRRWHISLMSWFRDYLFIPLGGSRVAPRRVYFNIMVVMVLSGLWHGAGWNWLLWGALNGVCVCAERYAQQRRDALGIVLPKMTFLGHAGWAFLVFTTFCFGGVIFLSHRWPDFAAYVSGLFNRWEAPSPDELQLALWLAIYAAITIAIDAMQRRTKYHEFPAVMKPVPGGLVLGAMIVAIVYWSVSKGVPYFYFQF